MRGAIFTRRRRACSIPTGMARRSSSTATESTSGRPRRHLFPTACGTETTALNTPVPWTGARRGRTGKWCCILRWIRRTNGLPATPALSNTATIIMLDIRVRRNSGPIPRKKKPSTTCSSPVPKIRKAPMKNGMAAAGVASRTPLPATVETAWAVPCPPLRSRTTGSICIMSTRRRTIRTGTATGISRCRFFRLRIPTGRESRFPMTAAKTNRRKSSIARKRGNLSAFSC